MLKKTTILLFCFLTFLSFQVRAQNGEQELIKLLGEAHTMQADFNQVLVSHGKVMQHSSGKMALKRPGKFCWETYEPMHQLLIVNGEKVIIYDHDLEQIVEKKLQKQQNISPALLLSGTIAEVKNRFVISLVNSVKADMRFELKPKVVDDFLRLVTLKFNGSNLEEMRFVNSLGQTSIVYFANSKINVPLSVRLFDFVYPNGVEIIKG